MLTVFNSALAFVNRIYTRVVTQSIYPSLLRLRLCSSLFVVSRCLCAMKGSLLSSQLSALWSSCSLRLCLYTTNGGTLYRSLELSVASQLRALNGVGRGDRHVQHCAFELYR